jgi:hypothetical protein
MINLDLVEDAGIFRSRRAAARQLGLLILSYFSKILCHNDRAMHASHSKYVLNDVTIGLSLFFLFFSRLFHQQAECVQRSAKATKPAWSCLNLKQLFCKCHTNYP